MMTLRKQFDDQKSLVNCSLLLIFINTIIITIIMTIIDNVIIMITLRKQLEDRRILMNWSLLKVPSLPANLITLMIICTIDIDDNEEEDFLEVLPLHSQFDREDFADCLMSKILYVISLSSVKSFFFGRKSNVCNLLFINVWY